MYLTLAESRASWIGEDAAFRIVGLSIRVCIHNSIAVVALHYKHYLGVDKHNVHNPFCPSTIYLVA
jgi:hypothetical protein